MLQIRFGSRWLFYILGQRDLGGKRNRKESGSKGKGKQRLSHNNTIVTTDCCSHLSLALPYNRLTAHSLCGVTDNNAFISVCNIKEWDGDKSGAPNTVCYATPLPICAILKLLLRQRNVVFKNKSKTIHNVIIYHMILMSSV